MKHKVLSIKYFILFLTLLALNTCFLILTTNVASAEGASLKIAPSLLQVKLHPPTEINAPITIENTGNEAVTLKPELRLFKASPKANGQIEYITNPGKKADFLQNVQLKDGGQAVSSLTLAARQSRELQLNIQIPSDTAPQDVYFSVMFISEQNGVPSSDTTSVTLLNAGIAMNVILSIGNSQPQAVVEEFSAPGFVQKGPITFTVKIQNKGSEYIKPKGNIIIKNMFGQTIGKIDLYSDTILASSSRFLGSSDRSQIKPDAVWNEKFLLGFYEAKLTVQPTADAIPLTQTIHFTAIPVRLVVGFIVAILFGVTIYHRVREKMKER